MAIFKLYPAHKDYLWGGQRLNQEFNKGREGIVAETWELSVHPDGPSTLIQPGGPYDNRPLSDYLADNPQALGREGDLAILIKLIDAAKDLSIQVHPDNDYALAREGQAGKTECWYILDAQPKASIYYGLKEALSREDLRAAIENNRLLDKLNKVEVKAGDFFYIPAGTIHAIGAGILIAEIQQNSNVTYRVFDFNRRDKEGNLRELHIDKAIEVAKLSPSKTDYDFNGHLCQTPYFTVDKLEVTSELSANPANFQGKTSFHSLLVLDGKGSLTDGQIAFPVQKGDSFFISADHTTYHLNGHFTILLTTLGQ